MSLETISQLQQCGELPTASFDLIKLAVGIDVRPCPQADVDLSLITEADEARHPSRIYLATQPMARLAVVKFQEMYNRTPTLALVSVKNGLAVHTSQRTKPHWWHADFDPKHPESLMLTAGEIASTEYADATLEEVGLSEKIVARYDKPGVPNLIDETVRKYIDRNPLRHIRPPARSITLSNTQVPHRAPAVSENRACAILIVY